MDLVIAVVGGVLGFLARSFWDVRGKANEWLVSRPVLVNLQLKGQLGPTGQKRLRKALADSVGDLASRMRPSARTPNAPVFVPTREGTIIVRPSSARGTTLCPDAHAEGTEGGDRTSEILYLRVDRPSSEGQGELAISEHVLYGSLTQFDKVAGDNHKAFLSLPRQNRSAWLWVDASVVKWKRASVVNECLDRLQERVRGKYPGLDVVLEINAAKDVVQEFEGKCVTAQGVGEKTAQTNTLPEILYVETRDKVYDFVSVGRAFWCGAERSSGTQLLVPHKILTRRAAGLAGALAGDWCCLTIRGPAGVGKTQTARQIVEQFCNQRQAIAVELSASDLGEMATTLPQGEELDVLAKIVEVLKRRLTTMNADQGNVAVTQACADVAAKVIIGERDRIKLVVADDLDSFRELRQWMQRATDQVAAPDMNVNLVRVFRRSGGGAESATGEPTLDLDLFDADDGKEILLANRVGKDRTDRQAAEDLISRSPFAGSGGVSLYGLRLVTEWLGSAEGAQPAEVLRSTVDNIIEPMTMDLELSVPYGELRQAVDGIRDLLASGAADASEIQAKLPKGGRIELVELLGDLAWHSRYSEQSALTAKAVVDWSSGTIKNRAVAERLLTEGVKAGIFWMEMGTAWWRDQLVADGCAVMRLSSYPRHGDSRAHGRVVANMIVKIVENNASEMLWMAADYDTFNDLISSVAVGEQNVDAIGAVLSDAAINWLTRRREALGLIVQTLIDLADRLEDSGEMFSLSGPLWKLATKDDNLLELFRQGPDRGKGGPIGVFVLARAYTPQLFQEQCSRYGTIAQDAASRCWGAEEGERLAAWCGVGEGSRYFRHWCERQRTDDVIAIVSREIEKNRQNLNNAFRERGLPVAVDVLSRRRLLDAERTRLASELGKCVSGLGEEFLNDLVSALVRTLDIGHGFLRDGAQWRVDSARKFAVPSAPLGPSTIKEVITRVLNTRLSLPTSDDLNKCDGLTFRGREWVGDNLPSNFPEGIGEDGLVEIPDLSWIRFWDGHRETGPELGDQERKQIGRVTVRWRPRVDLAPRNPAI